MGWKILFSDHPVQPEIPVQYSTVLCTATDGLIAWARELGLAVFVIADLTMTEDGGNHGTMALVL